MDNIIVICPHCIDYVIINKNDINCAIFRHAIYKDTLKQIDPHMVREECEKLVKEDKIYGCGKPFKLIMVDSDYIAIVCDYI